MIKNKIKSQVMYVIILIRDKIKQAYAWISGKFSK